MNVTLNEKAMDVFLRELLEVVQRHNVACIVGVAISNGIVAPFSARPKQNLILESDELKRAYFHQKIVEICDTDTGHLKGSYFKNFKIGK